MMTKDDAIKWLDNLTQDIGQMRHQDLWDYAQALSEISQMIADFFEVVKCKDCKKQNECGLYVDSEPEWFCADGERKESKIKKCFDIPKEVAERLLEDTERKEQNDR